MDTLSAEIALAVYGVVAALALWYRAASDGGLRRRRGYAPGPAVQVSPRLNREASNMRKGFRTLADGSGSAI